MIQANGYFQYFSPYERMVLPKGRDVSEYHAPFADNGAGASTQAGYTIDRTNGHDFIIFKAGITSITTYNAYSQDSAFTVTNVNKFREVGLKIGTYWYSRYLNVYYNTSGQYPGGYTDANLQACATTEATNYANVLESVFGAGKCGDIIPCLDFEDNRFTAPAVMTPHQAYVYMKAFSDTLIARFPQLSLGSGGNGIMLYTAYYFIGSGTGGDVRHNDTTPISTHIPRLWWSAGDPILGVHGATNTGTDYTYASGNYNFNKFGGYDKWVIWQYATDRNRIAKQFLSPHDAEDINVLDNINFSMNSILSYPQTLPKGIANTQSKYADKNHSHIDEYLPTFGGTLDGVTKIINPDGLFFKQEQNKSWAIRRTSASDTTAHVAGNLTLVPSASYYDPFNRLEAEDWATTKAITFTEDGEITTKSFDSSKVVPAQYTVTNIAPSTPIDETSVTFRNATDTGGGSWFSGSHANHYGGTVQLTNVTNEFATYTFIGTGIAWYTAPSTNRGIANIYIDGVLMTTYDAYAASPAYQVKAYEKTDLAFGSHTIKIVNSGTKNASSTGYYIVVDYLAVLNSGSSITDYVKKDGTTAMTGGLTTPKVRLTPEGGIAYKWTNRTGAASVKGTLVEAHDTIDNAFQVAPTSDIDPMGFVYESGVADGQDCWVVVYGVAEALIVDSVAATRAYVALSSATVAGRIDLVSPTTINTTEHWRECGHSLESKTA